MSGLVSLSMATVTNEKFVPYFLRSIIRNEVGLLLFDVNDELSKLQAGCASHNRQIQTCFS